MLHMGDDNQGGMSGKKQKCCRISGDGELHLTDGETRADRW